MIRDAASGEHGGLGCNVILGVCPIGHALGEFRAPRMG